MCVFILFHRGGFFRLLDVSDILEKYGSTMLCCEYYSRCFYRVPFDDDTRRMRHPHDVTLPPLRPCMGAISFLVSAQYHCVIVYSLVATGYCPAALYHGLRLTTSVIRHSYGLWVRLCHALSAFWGLSCPLCCHVAFLAFALPYLGFTLA